MKVEALAAIAIAAGREIMSVYNDKNFRPASKGRRSLVTEADGRAEAVILRALNSEACDMPIIAEEEVAAGRVPAAADRFFLVDPLDGTREFINQNGEFTVNIALIENGRPTMGIAYAPALGKIFAGTPTGSWRADLVDGELRRSACGERRSASWRSAAGRTEARKRRSGWHSIRSIDSGLH